MPTLQQSRGLLVKLGLLESQSTVPRRKLELAKTSGEAGPPRFVKYSVTSESEPELAESLGGDSSSDQDEQFMQLLRNMGQERALRGAAEFDRRC